MLASFGLDADDYPVFRVWNVFDLRDPASYLMLMGSGIGHGFGFVCQGVLGIDGLQLAQLVLTSETVVRE